MGCPGDNLSVRTFRGAWSIAGLVAGAAGLAASYFVAMAMTVPHPPVIAVADLVVALPPAWVPHFPTQRVGHRDKPLLLPGILVVLGLLFAWEGRFARLTWW